MSWNRTLRWVSRRITTIALLRIYESVYCTVSISGNL
jgi:hypothetical protein